MAGFPAALRSRRGKVPARMRGCTAGAAARLAEAKLEIRDESRHVKAVEPTAGWLAD